MTRLANSVSDGVQSSLRVMALVPLLVVLSWVLLPLMVLLAHTSPKHISARSMTW